MPWILFFLKVDAIKIDGGLILVEFFFLIQFHQWMKKQGKNKENIPLVKKNLILEVEFTFERRSNLNFEEKSQSPVWKLECLPRVTWSSSSHSHFSWWDPPPLSPLFTQYSSALSSNISITFMTGSAGFLLGFLFMQNLIPWMNEPFYISFQGRWAAKTLQLQIQSTPILSSKQ